MGKGKDRGRKALRMQERTDWMREKERKGNRDGERNMKKGTNKEYGKIGSK